MKTFAKEACLVLLAAWAGSALSLAQTNPPPAATATNGTLSPPPLTTRTNRPRTNTTTIAIPAPVVTRIPSRRFSGKIVGVDSKTQTITLLGGEKAGIGITDKTTILRDKKAAAFDVLAVGQSVNGMERQDAAGKWQAETLNVGAEIRQPAVAPVVTTVAAAPGKEIANIHILVPGGASDSEFSFGDLPAQEGIVRTNILSRVLARASADAFYTRTIHVDGGAVVAWYPNMGDMDIICHVAPGKHEVSVLVKDLNTGQVTQAGPITVFMQPGETQNADFR